MCHAPAARSRRALSRGFFTGAVPPPISVTPPPHTVFNEFPPRSTSADPGSRSGRDHCRHCWERGTQRVHPNFRPTSSRNNGLSVPRRPLLPHAAAAALRTLSLLFSLAGKRRSSRYFLPSPAMAPRGTCCSISHPLPPPRDRPPPRGQAGTRSGCCPSAGRWPCSKGTPAAPRTPPLCTSCWKRFPFCCSKSQLKTRLKNVQNAGFASFPLCVSVCSANRALPQSSALALTFGNKREAFILIGKQDYKLAVKL